MNYAVMTSMPGYMPDNFEVYTTLTDARNGAQETAEQFREDGYHLRGNKQIGYAVYRDVDGQAAKYPAFIIEITETEEEPE